MNKIICICLLLSIGTIAARAQSSSIEGTVKDADKLTPVTGATVSIFLKKDTSKNALKSTVTDSTGTFIFTGMANDSFLVELSSVGYQKIVLPVAAKDSLTELGTIPFSRGGKELEAVTVISKVSPVLQKADTTEFNAKQFKVNPDATTEDLIKKMPGITVAKDGTVTAQGEQIKKVTIDGKDFFGDDASAALKNLPSDVVDKIQVFDRLSDQAKLTGFDDGNSVKALNIVTKSGIKNGQFGRVYAGYGTDDRYSAGGNVSFFNGNRRISLIGNFNNINQQNFGSQDLLGITSGGGRGGGGRGGGGADNFSVGQTPGISKTNAFGINYSNQIGKKLTITGSYFFNNSSTSNASLVNTETFFSPKNQLSLQKSNSMAVNNNHRVNLRLEYKIDSFNSIFIIPSINFQNNNSSNLSSVQNYYGTDDSLNTSLNNSRSDRQGYNIRNSLLFRHSFKKKGRSLSVAFNTNFTKNDGESYTNASYRFFRDGGITDSLQNQFYDNNTDGNTLGGNIAYTEPIGKKGQIQIDYTPSVQKNNADQQTFLYDGTKYTKFDSTLSNRFNNVITTHNAGLNYRLGQSRDNQFSAGVNFQQATLESQRVFPVRNSLSQDFKSVLPNLRWMRKISKSSSIRMFYRASVNFPSVNQLQDVVDLSNPLRVTSGNPALKQSYTNLVSGRYTYTNSKNASSFFANIFLQTASDYVSNATYLASTDSVIQQGIVLKRGSQLSKPVNLDGYKSLRTFFTYSIPVTPIKTTVNLNTGFTYSKLPGLQNYQLTKTNSYAYNGGIVLASNISEYVDFNISYGVTFNNAQTIAAVRINNKYVNQSTGMQLNLLNKKGWFISNDLTNQKYTGLSSGFNQNYWLWNAAVGKKMGKKKEKEIRLSVFDLLKQNQSISRTVTGAYIEDAQNQVLQQYFMLTFAYSLKNFGVAARNSGGGGFNPNREGPGRPGGF